MSRIVKLVAVDWIAMAEEEGYKTAIRANRCSTLVNHPSLMPAKKN
jgi:hypothetical protein